MEDRAADKFTFASAALAALILVQEFANLESEVRFVADTTYGQAGRSGKHQTRRAGEHSCTDFDPCAVR